MLAFAISSLPFAPLFPLHQCRVLHEGKFSFQKHSFPYCCKAYAPAGQPGAQAWEVCTLPLHYRRHDTSQETRQWLLAIAPTTLSSFSLPNIVPASHIQHKVYTSPLPWPSFTALPKFAIMCSKQPHMHDKVHLHQPAIEPGSH